MVISTTVSDTKALCPLDRVHRQFRAERPNQLWVSDFTHVSTWQGWLYVVFVVDVFAHRIVGWRVSSSMRTDFILDALEQAIYARQPERDGSLVYHSYKGFPTFASNTSPWVDRTAINPGMVFVNFRSAPSLVHAARRCFLANGADGVTTNGHYAAFWLAANPDERRAPGAPFVSRALGWLPWVPLS